MTKTKANLLVFLTAVIYGAYFIVQKIASDMGFGAAAIIFIRSLIFTAAAFAFLGKDIKTFNRKDILIGSLIGFLNFLGFFFQALGSQYSTPSNTAFITCLNAVFVPLFAWLMYRTRPSKKSFVSLPLALLGTAVLTNIFAAGGFVYGDLFSLACALIFAVVIVLLGNLAKGTDYKKLLVMLALWQTVGGLTLFGAVEKFALPSLNWLHAIPVFLFLGLISSFAASALQTYAQRFTSETATVLILSLESVIACLLSVAVYYIYTASGLNADGFDKPGWPLLGGLLIVAAVVFLIYDFKKKGKPEAETGLAAEPEAADGGGENAAEQSLHIGE